VAKLLQEYFEKLYHQSNSIEKGFAPKVLVTGRDVRVARLRTFDSKIAICPPLAHGILMIGDAASLELQPSGTGFRMPGFRDIAAQVGIEAITGEGTLQPIFESYDTRINRIR